MLYHGTTKAFNRFNIKKTSKESHAGSGIYLTTCYDDARDNYTKVDGPDVKYKIRRIAWNELPYSALGNHSYMLYCEVDDNAKLATISKNDFFTVYEYNEDDEYEQELTEFGKAIKKIDDELNSPFIMSHIYESDITLVDLIKIISDNFSYDDDYRLYPGEVFKQIIIAAGYDGVIYENPGYFFGFMRGWSAQHYVVYNKDKVKIVEREKIESIKVRKKKLIKYFRG